MTVPVLRATDIAMWSAGLDWVRLTMNPTMYGQLAGAEERYRTAALRVAREAGYTGQSEPWSMRGYKGEKWGASGWGVNYHAGLMLDVSGYMADYAYDLPVAYTGVPRLDIQVTLWLVADVPRLFERCADASERARSKAAHRPWKVRTAETRGGGGTAYLGERKESAVFVRIYDKMREAEQKGEDASLWSNAWRFEIELKEGEGASIFEEMRWTTDKMKFVSTYVDYYLRRRGIVLPTINGGAIRHPRPKESYQDANERRLQWLNRYVAPTVDRLLSAGVSLERVKSALEIGE